VKLGRGGGGGGGGGRGTNGQKNSPCAVVMEDDSVKRGGLITRGRNGGQPGEQPTWQKEKEKTEACCGTRKSCLVKRQEISCVQRDIMLNRGPKGRKFADVTETMDIRKARRLNGMTKRWL